MRPGKTLDDARAVARTWLAAARSMKNGGQLQVSIRYPIIVGASENRFDFVVTAPSLAAWGAFYDTYDDGTPVASDPDVRADLVFFETPAGGAVFSTGSIAWAGSLAHDGYRNDVSRITRNVLRRFLAPAPFAHPE